jgi:hypothetical protein
MLLRFCTSLAASPTAVLCRVALPVAKRDDDVRVVRSCVHAKPLLYVSLNRRKERVSIKRKAEISDELVTAVVLGWWRVDRHARLAPNLLNGRRRRGVEADIRGRRLDFRSKRLCFGPARLTQRGAEPLHVGGVVALLEVLAPFGPEISGFREKAVQIDPRRGNKRETGGGRYPRGRFLPAIRGR